MDVVKLAREIRRALIVASKESIPLKKNSKIGVKWWNLELTEEKREVYRARRSAQKEKKNMDRRQELIRKYYAIKTNYDRNVEETRQHSWEEYLSEAAKDPWGYAYKLSCDKLKTQTVISSVSGEDGPTVHWRDTAETLEKIVRSDTTKVTREGCYRSGIIQTYLLAAGAWESFRGIGFGTNQDQSR